MFYLWNSRGYYCQLIRAFEWFQYSLKGTTHICYGYLKESHTLLNYFFLIADLQTKLLLPRIFNSVMCHYTLSPLIWSPTWPLYGFPPPLLQMDPCTVTWDLSKNLYLTVTCLFWNFAVVPIAKSYQENGQHPWQRLFLLSFPQNQVVEKNSSCCSADSLSHLTYGKYFLSGSTTCTGNCFSIGIKFQLCKMSKF